MPDRPSSPSQPLVPHCIAELVRTGACPSFLILRVEKILDEFESHAHPRHSTLADNVENTTAQPKESAYRLYLSDGDRMIQSVLVPDLHSLIGSGNISEGGLLELRRYKLRRAKRKSGNGEVVYLAIQDCVRTDLILPTPDLPSKDILLHGGGFLLDEDNMPFSPRPLQEHFEALPWTAPAMVALEVPSSQESEVFETVTVNSEKVKKRRETLLEMRTKVVQKRRSEAESEPLPRKRLRAQLEPGPEHGDVEVERASIDIDHNHQQSTEKHVIQSEPLDQPTPLKQNSPVPFHTLDSLLHPPVPLPTKNYPVTVFAVISWISPTLVHRPGSPFPPRRTLKLHDPSIDSRQIGVSISIFIDASKFTPRHGTVALFTGVVMQMYRDEIILNAYPGLKNTDWYVDDEDKLADMGLDVQTMREWWDERKRTRNLAKPASRGTVQA